MQAADPRLLKLVQQLDEERKRRIKFERLAGDLSPENGLVTLAGYRSSGT